MRPPYDLNHQCNYLRWDDVFENWFCSSTGACYRLYSDCPFVEALTKDVLSHRIELNEVPFTVRHIVQERFENNSDPVELYFF